MHGLIDERNEVLAVKKLWFVALAMFILCVLCGAAMADGTIYTVTIEPGEGSGSTFTVQSKTIISQSEMVAGNYDRTKGLPYDCQDHINCLFIAE